MPEKKKLSKNIIAMVMIFALSAAANITAALSPSAADFYMKRIFAPLSDIISSAVGILPFSLGEILIALGILLLIATPFAVVIGAVKKKKRFLKGFGIFFGWVLIYIIFTETFNCFVLYRTTEFSPKYHNSAGAAGFTKEQLSTLCEETILSANALAEEISRDENGDMLLPDNFDSIAERAMNILSEEYPELKGVCPDPKKINGAVMTSFDLQGIYFPFTLEANYNKALSPARVPCTVMHELSHLKGFIREDEAGFIAYRACLEAEEPEVRYSGHISAMNYLLSACKRSLPYDEYLRLCSLVSPLVRQDNTFVSEEYMEYIRQKAVIPTEKTQAVSAKAIDTTLKIGGVSDGKKSYGRMTDLLLEYRYYVREDITSP
ncbi:MAG: DUF3810 domain-containing protein [Huintestinicola sp.]|uniref:DUF3810 domain-containing protein n=1 Tax=Huintestinicola sp. TaxID=2981661 RepID=UPI003EFE3B74